MTSEQLVGMSDKDFAEALSRVCVSPERLSVSDDFIFAEAAGSESKRVLLAHALPKILRAALLDRKANNSTCEYILRKSQAFVNLEQAVAAELPELIRELHVRANFSQNTRAIYMQTLIESSQGSEAMESAIAKILPEILELLAETQNMNRRPEFYTIMGAVKTSVAMEDAVAGCLSDIYRKAVAVSPWNPVLPRMDHLLEKRDGVFQWSARTLDAIRVVQNEEEERWAAIDAAADAEDEASVNPDAPAPSL